MHNEHDLWILWGGCSKKSDQGIGMGKKGKDKTPSSLHSLINMQRFRRENPTEPNIPLYKGLIQTDWNMV